MADLNQVRIQILDENTGAVIDSVDPKTSDGAVYLPDGATLRSWIAATEEAYSEFQVKLASHLAKQHVDPEKVDSLFTAMSYNRATGVFTITKHNGQTQNIDTLLEKVIVNFTMEDKTVYNEVTTPDGDPSAQGYFEKDGEDYTASTDTTVDADKTYYVAQEKTFLVLTNDDGSKQELDVTKLIDVYTGSNGEKIVVTVDDNKQISANIVEGSIAYDDLDEALQAKVDAEYTLPAATTTALGGVIVGDGISVDSNGKISASNIKYTDAEGETSAVALKIADEENTVVIAVAGPADTVVSTVQDTAVAPLVVTPTITGDAAANASATYQWYKKTIGTDVAFTAIEGATAATLPAANIDVTAAGTTLYFCTVGATGDGVVADPVTTKRVVVVVEEAAPSIQPSDD